MVAPIRLLVGLGNPGARYRETRHNAGVWWLDQCCNEFNTKLKPDSKFHGEIAEFVYQQTKCWLLFPTTFMNVSGQAVQAVMQFYKLTPAEVLVAHDELDLPIASLRLKFGGGHGGHNGLRSIGSCIGSNDYLRLRIGIGRPAPNTMAPVDYVLAKPASSERDQIDQSLNHSLNALSWLLAGARDKAMQAINTVAS